MKMASRFCLLVGQMMTSKPEPWEIWHARFNYDDGKGYKYRPVIVLGSHPDGLLVMMVTSASNKLHLEHDCLIRDWREAGLDKPSIARADRIAATPVSYLGSAGRIGKLTKGDIDSLATLLAKMTGCRA